MSWVCGNQEKRGLRRVFCQTQRGGGGAGSLSDSAFAAKDQQLQASVVQERWSGHAFRAAIASLTPPYFVHVGLAFPLRRAPLGGLCHALAFCPAVRASLFLRLRTLPPRSFRFPASCRDRSAPR